MPALCPLEAGGQPLALCAADVASLIGTNITDVLDFMRPGANAGAAGDLCHQVGVFYLHQIMPSG